MIHLLDMETVSSFFTYTCRQCGQMQKNTPVRSRLLKNLIELVLQVDPSVITLPMGDDDESGHPFIGLFLDVLETSVLGRILYSQSTAVE